tara:strand:- start:605 stop:1114 length:510 start_codon:yes stop_codon:yes gene_type:complete
MSDELDQYLSKLPIYVFKLMDGNTIIARLLKDADAEEGLVYVSQPQSVVLDGRQIIMHEYMYGCEANKIHIDTMNIITYSEATLRLKNFYSKCILQAKIDDIALDTGVDNEETEEKELSWTDFISSFIDGLEPKDSTEDEDILSPWRNRMQWSPKADSPIEDEDDDSLL